MLNIGRISDCLAARGWGDGGEEDPTLPAVTQLPSLADHINIGMIKTRIVSHNTGIMV